MPFLVTEPQKIEGTKLGFAVFPYQFDFNDHITSKEGNRKLYIYLLKDSSHIEVEQILGEELFRYEDVAHDFVDKRLQLFALKHPEFIVDKKGFCDFFGKGTQSEKSQSKFSDLEKRMK